MRELKMDLDMLTKTVHSASRKKFFRQKPMFTPYRATSLDELEAVERKIGIAMPSDLRRWILALGYGDIDEDLSFREEWFVAIESGELKGGALFAQDTLGNFYGFDICGCIYFFSRSAPVFSKLSESFSEFIEELVRRDYRILDWVDALATQRYEW
jgi:hypothetical protein